MNEANTLTARRTSPLQQFVEHDWFRHTVIALIVISAILLGMETFRDLPQSVLDALFRINRAILAFFVIELTVRIAAYRLDFFRDPWNWFDFVIVLAAAISPSGPFQVLRALRILRALRLVSTVPSLRRVVDGLLSAVPGIASVMLLLVLLLYVAAVMATLMFRDIAPELFGNLGVSLFSLFQVMTLEGWPDIARTVMASAWWAWIFFVGFILLGTFMVLNLVIGIVVSSIQARIEAEQAQSEAATDAVLLQELRELRREVGDLRAEIERKG